MSPRFLLLALALVLSQHGLSLVLRAADNQPPDFPTVQALRYMGEQIAEQTDGALTVKVYPARQLGEENDTVLATIFGAIDINRINCAPLANMVPEFALLSLPYLFRDQAHMREVLSGPIGEEILAFLRPHDLVGLAFLDSGARSFYAKRPIRSPADLKGLKIRVQNTDQFITMMRTLGANATPMSFGQVYESLLTGVIDGAENNWPSYVATRHFEVAPYYSLDRHSMVPEVIVMSRARWDSLDAGEQAIVKRAATSAARYMNTLWDARVTEAEAKARAAGVTVTEDIDLDAFRAAVQPMYRDYLEDPVIGPLIRRIRNGGAQ